VLWQDWWHVQGKMNLFLNELNTITSAIKKNKEVKINEEQGDLTMKSIASKEINSSQGSERSDQSSSIIDNIDKNDLEVKYINETPLKKKISYLKLGKKAKPSKDFDMNVIARPISAQSCLR